jgi:uncharacterized protein (DUF1501 family)
MTTPRDETAMTTTSGPACCDELARATRLSRRRLIQGMAAAGATGVATSLFGDAFRQTAFAGQPGGNVLVVLSLRGGIDGLGVVVPHGDPGYYTARPRIAVPRESLVAQDGFFGLHPAMQPLEWLWSAGELAAVHAVGLPVPNRSHFSAMEEIEDADTGSDARRGWVNRMIGLTGTTDPTTGIHLSTAAMPTLIAGPTPTIAVDRVSQVAMIGADKADEWSRRRRKALSTMWRGRSALGPAYRSAAATVDKMAPLARTPYTPAVAYPTGGAANDLSEALRDTAQLIKADLGTEVVSIDYGTWDLHSDYGTLAWGDMQNLVAGFAKALDAFMRDLGPLRSRVTVVTISEFGRRLMENGNGGLDHGWGNMMLVAGGGVRGGAYYGAWPGLGTGREADADLRVTTDYRNVLGEVLARRFPDRSLASVFPGVSYAPRGVML